MNAAVKRTDTGTLIREWQEKPENKRPSSPPGLSSPSPVGTRSNFAVMSNSTANPEDERGNR